MKYNYDTGYKGVLMDVTISGAEEESTGSVNPNDGGGGCGGGCDAGFGVFALLSLAVLLMRKNKK